MKKFLDNIFFGTPDRAWFWSTTFPFFFIASLFKRRTVYVSGGVYDGLTEKDFEDMRNSPAAIKLKEVSDEQIQRLKEEWDKRNGS